MKSTIIFLATDIYGASGGIAHYNRMMVDLLSKSKLGKCVQVLARLRPAHPHAIPENVSFFYRNLNYKIIYVFLSLYLSFKAKDRTSIFCGHINLLPLAFVLKCLFGFRVTLQIHGVESWERRTGFMLRLFLRHVDLVLSVSKISADRFLSWSQFDGKIIVFPNFIEVNKFREHEPSNDSLYNECLQFSNGRKLLLTVARLSAFERYKGIDEVIDLLASRSDLRRRCCYVVCGEGDDISRLRAKVADLGLLNDVLFPGFVSEVSKKDMLSIAHICILAGTGEGFGIFLLEAVAAGAHAIASSRDGSQEALLNGELGDIVDPYDSKVLEAVIRKLLNEEKAFKEKIYQFDIIQAELECQKIYHYL